MLAHKRLQYAQLAAVEIGAAAARIERVDSGPFEEDLIHQRVARLNIVFAGEALDQRLQSAARVPRHRLVEAVSVAPAPEIGQLHDRSGDGDSLVGDRVHQIALEPYVGDARRRPVSPSKGADFPVLVAVRIHEVRFGVPEIYGLNSDVGEREKLPR